MWRHQNESMIIPGGFQKNHNAPIYAHHPPRGGARQESPPGDGDGQVSEHIS